MEMKVPTWKAYQDLVALEESCGIVDFDSLDVATEGYIGNTKYVEKLVKACDAACRTMAGKGNVMDVSFSRIDGSKEIRNIEMVLKEMFGFKDACIRVFNSAGRIVMSPIGPIIVFADDIGAYTYPYSPILRNVTSDMPRMPTAHGERYYDNAHQYFCYIVTYSRMFTLLNGEEMAAIILHEVGHNFDVTMTNYIFDLISWILTLPSPVPMVSAVLKAAGTHIRFAWDSITKILDYIPIVPLFFNLGITGYKAFTWLLGPLGLATRLMQIVTRTLNRGLTYPLEAPTEAFADSFVAAHGLGSAFISALNKLEQTEYVTTFGPLVELWSGSGAALGSFAGLFLDPHFETQSRAKLILREMEEVSNDPNLPKPLRKAAKDDYNRCKKAYDKFLQADPDERNACVTRFSRNVKEHVFGGSVDIRALFWARFGTKATDNR